MARTILLGIVLWAAGGSAFAQGTCVFDIVDVTMRLRGDCVTDAPIVVPDGFTLDGAGYVIQAVDPPGGVFRGGVVTNGGRVASVVDTTIVAVPLAPVCQAGAHRLRGIYFEGASGTIRRNSILNLTRGDSACPEGNGIEVRGREGTGPAAVEIAWNLVDGYQKTGVLVSGPIEALIHRNRIGSSAARLHLPANAVQIGHGARAVIEENRIDGNSWPYSDAAATGILLLGSAPGTVVRDNTIGGNADVGIYVLADGATIVRNLVRNVVPDTGADGFYDIGIGNYGSGNVFAANVVSGFATSYHGIAEEPATRAAQVRLGMR